jgi:hypothetical protein
MNEQSQATRDSAKRRSECDRSATLDSARHRQDVDMQALPFGVIRGYQKHPRSTLTRSSAAFGARGDPDHFGDPAANISP